MTESTHTSDPDPSEVPAGEGEDTSFVDLEFAPEAPAGDVFICTGGAGDDLAQAAALGCRTYVTGEGSHWNIPLAQEPGVNLVFGGHYFTETFGVKALGLLLKDVYGLDYTFIDLPPSAYSH